MLGRAHLCCAAPLLPRMCTMRSQQEHDQSPPACPEYSSAPLHARGWAPGLPRSPLACSATSAITPLLTEALV